MGWESLEDPTFEKKKVLRVETAHILHLQLPPIHFPIPAFSHYYLPARGGESGAIFHLSDSKNTASICPAQ